MTRKRVVVLGCGLVGHVIVADLLDDPQLDVLAVDAHPRALARLPPHPRLSTTTADLSRPEAVQAVAREADLAIGAVPGALGPAALAGVVAAGRPMVDISFAPAYDHDSAAAAARAGLPVIADCGVAPGLSNLLAGRECARLDEVRQVRILVGGLPVKPRPPFNYVFVFSPSDVIEEYTRPARLRREGATVTLAPLTEVESVTFDGVGTLEAFNTDGLRSLLDSLPGPELVEKTLRWPGHAALMEALRDGGFFGSEPVVAGDTQVRPRDLTEALFREAMSRGPDETEMTLMRVEVHGTHGGSAAGARWELRDVTDPATGRTSMSRTTAFPCALAARLVLAGTFTEPGLHFPEALGRHPRACDAILEGLKARGVTLTRRPL